MAQRSELGNSTGTAFVVRPKLWTDWIILCLVVGIAGGVIAALVLAVSETRHPVTLPALTGGVLLTVAGIAGAVWRRRLGWQVAVFEKGLEFRGPAGAVAIAFSDIAALGLTVKDEFSNGSFSGISRRLQLWRQQDPVKRPYVDLQAFCKAGKPEEEQLAQVITRLLGEAEARIEQVVASGGIAKGVGLQLSQTSLRVGTEPVPLEQITAAGLHGGRLCLWLDADAEPRYRLDPNLPNVLPIVQFVQKRLEERATGAGGANAEVAGLGRILFERRSSKAVGILLIVAGITTIWLGVGILLILWGWHMLVFRFRCHERGVYRRGLFSRRELLYREVASFTFSATRQYYNGAYVGTSITMNFVPEAAPGAKPIGLSRSVRNADRDLDELREHVGRVLAVRLLARLEQGTEVPWGPDALLTPNAVRYRRPKFIGKSDWTDLPYQEVAGTSINDGTLAVFAKGNEKPVLTMPVSAANFFPGYNLFCHLAGKANPQAA